MLRRVFFDQELSTLLLVQLLDLNEQQHYKKVIWRWEIFLILLKNGFNKERALSRKVALICCTGESQIISTTNSYSHNKFYINDN